MKRASDLLKGDRQDKAFNIILGFIALMALGTLVGVGWLISSGPAQQRSVDAIVESDAVSSCRSEFFAVAQRVAAELEEARALQDVVVNDGLRAAIHDDPAALVAAETELLAAKELVLSAVDAANEAFDRYEQAARRAAAHPDLFLAECRNGTVPTGG